MKWEAIKLHIPLFALILSLAIAFWPSRVLAVEEKELQSALLEQLEHRPAALLKIEGHRMDTASIDRALAKIYHESGLRPFWVSGRGPGERAKILLSFLKSASAEGLDPEKYRVAKIDEYWKRTNAVGLARLDILLTLALGGYVADAHEGRLDPRRVDPKLFASARDVEIDPVKLAEQALTTPDLRKFLQQQVPTHQHYRNLRAALVKYRAFAANGGWEPIPAGKTLKPGMSDERAPKIRKRLSITGDLKSTDLSSVEYDAELVKAVKHFQMRHGLKPDGVVGKGTLAALNVPAEKLVRRIIINMERWRWMSHDLGEVRIVVNIAGFHLGGINHGDIEMLMRVIVGKPYHKTPVFSDMIKYIEFNPYWNIPPSIARNEMLPKLKKNPNYLKERNIRVFSSWGSDAKELDSTKLDWHKIGSGITRYKLRQDPGKKNALGTVKFMFPNKFNVYLHDTPSHILFGRTNRTFSHGCIRVSKPAELAAYILGGEKEGWGLDRIREIIASGKRTVIRLKKPLPVHIAYRTAIVDKDGNVLFRNDVYGRDKLLEKALF